MASPNLSEIITTTLRNRSGKMADNVTSNNALLTRLREKGNIERISGGRTIVMELDYAENSSFQYYSGYEALNISPSDVLSAAEYDWKQASVSVTVSGLEQRQNSGTEAIVRLVDARVKNAQRTMANKISEGIYSDGTGSNSKQIGGLQLLVPGDPTTGTVGGIDRASYTFWRNNVYDFSDESVTASASTILAAMNELYVECQRGTDHPDLIVMGKTYWNYFWSAMAANQRYMREDKSAVAGFSALVFNQADVVYDGAASGGAGSSTGIADTRAYFLNTDYLKLIVHADADFKPMEQKWSVNQDAIVIPVLFQGNLGSSNLSLQGVLQA